MNMDDFCNLRKYFQSLDKTARMEFLKQLSSVEQLFFYKHPDLFLHDKQIIPEGEWLFFLLMCGRSFGKTFAGSAWTAKKIRAGAKVIGLCGPTYDDVAKVMVPAIQNWFLPDELDKKAPYNHQTHTLRFANGAKIYCYTSDKEIRGPNLEYLWCDEICVWADGIPDKIKERFEDLTRAVRVGSHPQTIITSTPKPHPFFIDFKKEIEQNNKNYQLITGTMFDNPFLPKSYIDEQIKKYGCTTRGRQEIYGELLSENPNALWTYDMLDKVKISIEDFNNKLRDKQFHIVRSIVAVDPAVSTNLTSDETGIVVGSLCSDGNVYIRGDYSGKLSPIQWASRAVDLYKLHNAAFIVLEANQGGNLLELQIKQINPYVRTKLIHASVGKQTRFEPCVSAYEQQKVWHVGDMRTMEDQMVNYNPLNKGNSPDRADACCYVIYELLLTNGMTYRDASAIGFFG
jgi:phage terminase large subunit-like protein